MVSLINLSEQCRKLAGDDITDITESYSDISINKLSSLIQDEASSFNERINSVLIIIEPDINLKLLRIILNNFNGKKISLFLADGGKSIDVDNYKNLLGDIFDKCKNFIVTYSRGCRTDYSFFGTTKAKIPILLHNKFLESDLILPICNIKPDLKYMVKSAKYLLAYGLMADKSDMKLSEIKSATELDNIATDICLIARSDVEYFAINYIEGGSGNFSFVNIGDILLSHIQSSEYFSNI